MPLNRRQNTINLKNANKYKAFDRQFEFIEIHVDADLATCEQRDPKGLYKKARAGEIKNFTGIDSVYEAPEKPELYLDNGNNPVSMSVQQIMTYLAQQGHIK